MTVDFKEGDRVVYYPTGAHSRPSIGVIQEIVTHTELVDTDRPVTVKASEEHPRYVIMNINTEKLTAYKRENIERLASDDEVEERHADEQAQQESSDSPHKSSSHKESSGGHREIHHMETREMKGTAK